MLVQQFREPEPDWVRFIARKVTNRNMTSSVVEVFTRLVLTASSQFLKDEANRRLRSAQDLEEVATSVEVESEDANELSASPTVESDVVTTEQELAAFNIVRAICCSEVPAVDIYLRDAKSYCAILYKNNNRKPIVRLHFDRTIPRISVFDKDKNFNHHDLANIEDIFQHSEQIRERIRALRDG